jgi:hypothetical protein
MFDGFDPGGEMRAIRAQLINALVGKGGNREILEALDETHFMKLCEVIIEKADELDTTSAQDRQAR